MQPPGIKGRYSAKVSPPTSALSQVRSGVRPGSSIVMRLPPSPVSSGSAKCAEEAADPAHLCQSARAHARTSPENGGCLFPGQTPYPARERKRLLLSENLPDAEAAPADQCRERPGAGKKPRRTSLARAASPPPRSDPSTMACAFGYPWKHPAARQSRQSPPGRICRADSQTGQRWETGASNRKCRCKNNVGKRDCLRRRSSKAAWLGLTNPFCMCPDCPVRLLLHR